VQAVKPAAPYALVAKSAAVNVIVHHELFFCSVNDLKLKRIGGTVFNAHHTAGAFFGFPVQLAAQPFGFSFSFKGIFFRCRLFEKRFNDIPKHGTN